MHFEKKSIIAVLPARGGSKRIPGKNIRVMDGIPIIGRTIIALKQSQVFDSIYVSTDSPQIAEIAESFGGIVPFLRDESLSDDLTPTLPVIANFLDKLELDLNVSPDYCCCVYPAAFMLEKKAILESLEILKNSPDFDYVATIARYTHPIQRALEFQVENEKISFILKENALTRTQDLESNYYDAGQLYWGRGKAWKEQVPIIGEHTGGYRLKTNSIVDIDTEEDWFLAEMIWKSKINHD